MLQRWAGFLRRSRIEAVDLPTAVDRLRAFLLPPWEVLARSAQFEGEWPAGGPWRVRNGR